MQQPLALIALFFTASCLLLPASVYPQNPPQNPVQIPAQNPNNTLSGIVTDSAGDTPLAGVSVFLNSTSIGTVTHADGSFVLGRIPRGKYDLVISAIGYETFVTNIDGNRLPASLKIVLHQKATVLQAFIVEPYLKNGWQQWGGYFIKNFIGETEYANSCTIKNKDVLRFHFSKKNNRLTVSATEPLIIENTALGYTLEFRLEEFASDFRTHIVTYYGYPFFREMATTRLRRQEKWEEHRREAYTGSIMHFMRSLFHNHLQEDGFIAQHAIPVANTEKQRVKNIYHPDLQKLDTFPIDTLHHFWEVLKQPDFFSRTVRIGADSLVTTYADGTRALFFTGKLTVIFGDPAKGMNYRGSTIFLVTPAMVTIEETGNYYPPQEIISSGTWAMSEKVANLLPLDYGQQ